MADDNTVQQLEEWKKKYYKSLAEFEEQQRYDELLQRSLGRLALAADGIDPALDTQLKSLRNVLKGKKSHRDIELILEKMERAISQMDADINDGSVAAKILAELLSSLQIPKKFKAESKSLIKQLSTADKKVSQLIPQVLSLLDECIGSTSASKASSGFSFNLFGSSKSSEAEEAVTEDSSSDLDNEPLDLNSNSAMPNHLVLMKLLERLSLPTDLSKMATKIRHDIEEGVADEQLPNVINNIAEIVSSLGSQAVTEKLEYQEFLEALTTKLQSLDDHIRETSSSDLEAFKERHAMSQAMEDEVKGIRGHVEKADDLAQLKSTVNERLDSLNQHFENSQESDRTRFEQSQKQIRELNNRLKAMEDESVLLRKSAIKSRELALKDALTGIWNRQALDEDLEKEFIRWQRYQKPLSLVIWDIDFFKRVNDTYGHAAGDKVLKTIARLFTQATRDADFIARFGGEEFVGIFPETRLEEALSLANKIREKIQNSKFHYEHKPVPITASAGLATFSPNDTIEDVFKRADAALYRAKEGGRNRCIAD
ncbi:MAG: diguanylate cyclase [Methylophaga sp.]|nr:diguanylate cyclase [Methylophaga sp.]